MDRDQIIALLVFGKSPSELDLDESESVGNTQTALESKAFGLASLYLFGATPIERVAYDSATGTYSVRLRLPGGANLQRLIGIVDRRPQTAAKASRVAVQHRCSVGPNESRPVAMETGTMRIGNGGGANDGYVTPDYYLYVQFLTNSLRP